MIRYVLLPWLVGLLCLLLTVTTRPGTSTSPVGRADRNRTSLPIPENPFEFTEHCFGRHVVSCGEAPVGDTLPLPPPPPPPPPPRHREIYKVVEQMPLFPGCDRELVYPERKACAERKLLEYVYGGIEWPASVREACCSGTAVISFVVETDGRVVDARIVRNPGCGTGKLALAAVRRMQTEDVRWEPGRQGGRAVPVQFNLPVRFELR